ncbi:MAG: hypothetical protein ACKESB_02635 [Candidatus Hodgkinia cicadicola]
MRYDLRGVVTASERSCGWYVEGDFVLTVVKSGFVQQWVAERGTEFNFEERGRGGAEGERQARGGEGGGVENNTNINVCPPFRSFPPFLSPFLSPSRALSDLSRTLPLALIYL